MTKIVIMCGSSRFCDVMAVCAWLIEKQEHAITMGLHLLPDWYTTVESHLAESEGVAEQMDELHLRKIDISDEIFVVNVNHYVGDSTAREVRYAMEKDKPIRWFTNDSVGREVVAMLENLMAGEKDRIEPAAIEGSIYDMQAMYHAHLDACVQCREYPFGNCDEGLRIMANFLARVKD